MSQTPNKFYVTTPIYYVNDRPHIGHVYTTTIADVLARYHRLRGSDTFFLTGTDEHAAKVVDAAAERGLSTQQWADQNAGEFESVFARLELSYNDFIRTSQPRHTQRVQEYVQALLDAGDIYQGQYEGWYDAGQEEYIPENKAKEYDYKSPFNNKPLVRKQEQNYFFRLSNYADAVADFVKAGGVQPEARANEVLARVNEGLRDVPISRSTTDQSEQWGIQMPTDPTHTIYVWIDALFNYLSTMDTDERRDYWAGRVVHLIAKDILWFHAVIWPALLTALAKAPAHNWIRLPDLVYAHSFWIAEGQKMSKSLGNFIDLEKIDHYTQTFGIDALRYFLAVNGPLGTTDADFAEAKFIDVYNSDLANTLGNCANRVTNMIGRYFDGVLPQPLDESEINVDRKMHLTFRYAVDSGDWPDGYIEAMGKCQLHVAIEECMAYIRTIDQYIDQTEPFKLAKDPERKPEVATILYNCAEALRIASLLLWPVLPERMQTLWSRIGCEHYTQQLAEGGRGSLDQWVTWGQLKPGTPIHKDQPLFPRYQPAEH